jgi:phage terminase large subunit-like protein
MADVDWLDKALKRLELMPQQAKDIRERAKQDLWFFARLVNPGYVYGDIHREIFRWMQDYNLYGLGNDLTSNKLIMLPRAHLKSHMVATWAAWIIVRHPEITILYVSATAYLAETQLYAIQNILESDVFQRYFPEYIHPQKGLREAWSSTEIIIDHSERKKQNVRDATIATAGLTTNTTGWHADVIIADDLVIPENAYTEDGRESVVKKASQFTSIRNAGGFTMACGTRYHPTDIYYTWANQRFEDYDDDGVKIAELPVWDIKEYAVETDDVYIWPRTIREDGKAFGFDRRILARIRAEYEDRVQFFAQYYNNPNESGSNRISRDCFQYYNPRFLKREGGNWFYKERRLNIYAAVDFAYTTGKRSDYTAIVVIGVDHENQIYVLDIDRFRVERTIDIFEHVVQLHSKWGFKKLSAEVVAAQKMMVEDIKAFAKERALGLSVVEYRPSKVEGTKEERIAATLEWRYENQMVWHFEGGWTNVLEEELVLARPPHDDVKDALTSAVSIAVKPASGGYNRIKDFLTLNAPRNRFGGI